LSYLISKAHLSSKTL